ncbi:MAG: hypothetical protein ACE5E6_07520 [Phycisphaerae bacterium]
MRMTHPATWLFSVMLIGATEAAPQAQTAPRPPRPLAARIVFTQIPVHAPAQHAPTAASRIVTLDTTRPRNAITVLTPGFVTARYPDVSFDGRRILFVGTRRQAPANAAPATDPADPSGTRHVWEINIDGTGLRRITPLSGPRVADAPAIYLSTMYTMDADRPIAQIAFISEEHGRAIHTCHMDGTHVRQITFNPYGVSDPWLLSDGRLLYSQRRPRAAGAGDAQASCLMTINTDGTDIFPFAAVHEPPADRGMPCETADGLVVYVESTSGDRYGGGSLVAVARTRSLHTRRVIAPDRDGLYCTPSPTVDGSLLVSYIAQAGASYGIHVLDVATGKRAGNVYDDPAWHDIGAVVAAPRPTPNGRSSVVDDRALTGWLYCLDASMSDRANARHVPPGSIRRVRVIRAARLASHEETLGHATVESDGSFFIEVPARTPLRLETLDDSGAVLQRMSNWIWVMPHERRGCIGCHEDRELTPPNRHVLALRRPAERIGTHHRGSFGAAGHNAPRGAPVK